MEDRRERPRGVTAETGKEGRLRRIKRRTFSWAIYGSQRTSRCTLKEKVGRGWLSVPWWGGAAKEGTNGLGRGWRSRRAEVASMVRRLARPFRCTPHGSHHAIPHWALFAQWLIKSWACHCGVFLLLLCLIQLLIPPSSPSKHRCCRRIFVAQWFNLTTYGALVYRKDCQAWYPDSATCIEVSKLPKNAETPNSQIPALQYTPRRRVKRTNQF